MNKNRLSSISSALSSNPTSSTYSQYVKDHLQDKANSDWDYASDVYDVLKESDNGTWETMAVRLIFPYSINSASTIKDDFKTVLFKDLQYDIKLGTRFSFNSYIWIVIDTGKNKSATSSCLIQRCSDELRWYSEDGLYHNEPAIISKNSLYNLDSDTMTMLPNNQLRALVKWNEASKLIKWADVNSTNDKYTRFILNEYAYRVVSIDRHSFIRNGKGYIDIRMVSDMIKPDADDLVNNIADGLLNNVSIDILNGNATLQNSQTLQLNTVVKKNNVEISNPTIIYTSATPTVASVSNIGLVTAITTGSSTISATYGNVSDSILISATPTVNNNYTTEFTSSINNITSLKINQQAIYTVDTKLNGVSYVDGGLVITVTDDTGLVSSDLVTIVSQTSNTITIKSLNDSANVGKYFRIYAIGTNNTSYLRILVTSIF